LQKVFKTFIKKNDFFGISRVFSNGTAIKTLLPNSGAGGGVHGVQWHPQKFACPCTYVANGCGVKTKKSCFFKF